MADLTPEALDALQEHIAQKAALIQMGEKIKWGSDTDALNDANAAISALRAQLATANQEAARTRMILQAVKAYEAGEPSQPPVTGLPKRNLIDLDRGFATAGAEDRWIADTAAGVYDSPSAPSPEAVARAALEWAAEIAWPIEWGSVQLEAGFRAAKDIRTAASDPATIAAIVAKAGGGE